MNEQNVIEISTSTEKTLDEQNVKANSTSTEKVSPAAEQLKQTTTKKGKPRARWTMKASFTDGNVFTYRSDKQKAFFTSKGYSNNGRELNEIEALVTRFSKVRRKILTAQIFDNSLPKGEETILDYSSGIILLNRLPRMSSGKSFIL